MNQGFGRTLRTAARSLRGVSTAILVSSLLGYGLLVIIGRVLTPNQVETFMVFWAVLLGIGAALGPLEQDITRQSAQAAVDGRIAGAGVYQAAAVGAVAVLVAGLLTAIPPLPARLFGDSQGLLWIALAGGLACVGYLTLRGLLLGHGRIGAYSGLLVAENAVRMALFAVLVAAGMAGVLPLAAAAAAGFCAWLVLGRRVPALADRHGQREPWPVVTRRILTLMAAAGLMASVLTGFPAVVGFFAPEQDATRLGTLFLALSAARVPLLLLSPVQALTVPTVVRLSQDEHGRARLRTLLVGLVSATVVVGAAGAALGALAGPWGVLLLFGPQHEVAATVMAALVWSSVMLGSVLLLTAVLVAGAKATQVMLTWSAVAGLSVLILAAGPGDVLARAVLGIAVAPTVGLAIASFAVLSRPARRSPVGSTR